MNFNWLCYGFTSTVLIQLKIVWFKACPAGAGNNQFPRLSWLLTPDGLGCAGTV